MKVVIELPDNYPLEGFCFTVASGFRIEHAARVEAVPSLGSGDAMYMKVVEVK